MMTDAEATQQNELRDVEIEDLRRRVFWPAVNDNELAEDRFYLDEDDEFWLEWPAEEVDRA